MNQNDSLKSTITILAVVIIALQVVSLLVGPNLVLKKMVNREVELYGGQENYDLVQDEQKKNIEQYIDSLKGSDGEAQPTAAAEAPSAPQAAGTIDDADFETISALYSKGEEDSTITIFEYSNLGCGFCKRHHNDDTLNRVAQQSEENVKIVVGINSGYKPEQSQATSCAGIIGGSDGYHKAKDHFFSDGGISGVAAAAGVDQGELDACIAENKGSELFNTVESLARKYGLTGTPGHLVINNETKEFTVVSGAYPVSQFISAIDSVK